MNDDVLGDEEVNDNLNIPFSTFELLHEVDEVGGQNLPLTYEFYNFDDLIKILNNK